MELNLNKLGSISASGMLRLRATYMYVFLGILLATIGVKNSETNEEKLILNAAKKELKEQEQSKNLGAPYSQKNY